MSGRWAGVPDTDEARKFLDSLADDDCPWALLDAALVEIDRLRAPASGLAPLPLVVDPELLYDDPRNGLLLKEEGLLPWLERRFRRRT